MKIVTVPAAREMDDAILCLHMAKRHNLPGPGAGVRKSHAAQHSNGHFTDHIHKEVLGTDGAEYNRNHRRVREAFGNASEYDCWQCGKPARDWAHLWKTHPDPSSPESYYPMCRSCHVFYDSKWDDPEYREAGSERSRERWQNSAYRVKTTEAICKDRRSAEGRARLSKQAKKRWDNPEWRAKTVESIRKAKRSPEGRAKQAQSTRRQWQEAKASGRNHL